MHSTPDTPPSAPKLPTPERMRDQLLRDLTAHDGPKVTTTVAVASWSFDELTRLARLDAAVSEYLAEMDSPAPDYSLRRILRDRLRAVVRG